MATLSLLEKLRKTRETRLPVGDDGRLQLIIRRPAIMDHIRHRLRSEIVYDWYTPMVVGWVGVIEQDILPGGTDDVVEFDHALAVEWIGDRPAVVSALTDYCQKLIDDYTAAQDALKKN